MGYDIDDNHHQSLPVGDPSIARRSMPAAPETKDSGSRRSFATGSVRDAAEGKGRYDLITPIALLRLAQLYERGAKKYAARNWEKGQPVTVFFDCAMRHMQKHLAGWRDEDHLAAALWNIAGAIHVEHQCERGKLPIELLDWPAPYVNEQDVNGPVYQPPTQ